METVAHIIAEVPDDNGIKRITTALNEHSGVRFGTLEEATHVFIIINGRRDRVQAQIEQLNAQDKKVILIHTSFRSSKNPKAKDWIQIWKSAYMVWSTYDLRYACLEEGLNQWFGFYYAPFGVSEDFIEPVTGQSRDYKVLTCSKSYLTESVKDCHDAVRLTGHKMAHLGEVYADDIDSYNGLTDRQVAELYARCDFVSGLRRQEGFEFPAAEGIMQGARPILFNYPDYFQWYRDIGVYVPDVPREQLTEILASLFKAEIPALTEEEIQGARELFSWERIIGGLWTKIYAGY